MYDLAVFDQIRRVCRDGVGGKLSDIIAFMKSIHTYMHTTEPMQLYKFYI